MIKLKKLDSDYIKKHLDLHKEKFFAKRNVAIKKGELPASGNMLKRRVFNYLEANIDIILVGKPDDLCQLIGQFDTAFPHLSAYFRDRSLPRGNKNKFKKQDRYEEIIKLIKDCFDYDSFSRRKATNSANAYSLVKEYEQRICAYCHMHHNNFYMIPETLELRPALDHFYPQSYYPWLAVSLYNLIPACEQCNSKIKLAKNPLKYKVISPLVISPVDIGVACQINMPLHQITDKAHYRFLLYGKNAQSRTYVRFFKLSHRYEWYSDEVLDKFKALNRYKGIPYKGLLKHVPLYEYLAGYSEHEKYSRALGIFNDLLIKELQLL